MMCVHALLLLVTVGLTPTAMAERTPPTVPATRRGSELQRTEVPPTLGNQEPRAGESRCSPVGKPKVLPPGHNYPAALVGSASDLRLIWHLCDGKSSSCSKGLAPFSPGEKLATPVRLAEMDGTGWSLQALPIGERLVTVDHSVPWEPNSPIVTTAWNLQDGSIASFPKYLWNTHDGWLLHPPFAQLGGTIGVVWQQKVSSEKSQGRPAIDLMFGTFDPSGGQARPGIKVAIVQSGYKFLSNPRLTTLDGDFLLAWGFTTGPGSDSQGVNTYVQRLGVDGTKKGAAILSAPLLPEQILACGNGLVLVSLTHVAFLRPDLTEDGPMTEFRPVPYDNWLPRLGKTSQAVCENGAVLIAFWDDHEGSGEKPRDHILSISRIEKGSPAQHTEIASGRPSSLGSSVFLANSQGKFEVLWTIPKFVGAKNKYSGTTFSSQMVSCP
jgi:hypothetical protein